MASRKESLRLFGRRVLLLALTLLAIGTGFGVWDAYRKNRESVVLRAQAENRLADLTKRETQLTGDIAKLATDRGVEETLREQYALAGQGEGLIVIVDTPPPPPAASSTSLIDRIRHFLWH